MPNRGKFTIVPLLFVYFMSAAPLLAADVVRPGAQRRFSKATKEVPSFQRHVVPLLSRLGCNGRSCHGSFQGKGGFRLSLFGYDFAMDHKGLRARSKRSKQLRVNLAKPKESLVLRKPTEIIDHEGGQRFKTSSWQNRLILKWIQSGANRGREDRLKSLTIRPSQLDSVQVGQSRSIHVVADWPAQRSTSKSLEDVTCLCRFKSLDPSVATVDEGGKVSIIGPGDTHIVAFYDNGVATLPVLVPHRVIPGQPITATTKIDQFILAKLRRLGIEASARCTDSEFLRRVSLDLTGTLPTPDEVVRFVAEKSANKRSRKIEELLKRMEYAAWWANRLCDATGNSPNRQSEGRLGQKMAVQWYEWMRARVAENTPYDQIVERIVLATGRSPGQSFADYSREMSGYFRDKDPSPFHNRPSMPYYWSRSNVSKPEDKALAFAHSFLGVRLQCAQCHKHPYDQWTKADFQSLTRFFRGVKYGIPKSSRAEYQRVARGVGGRMRGNRGVRISEELLAKADSGKLLPWRELFVESSGDSPRQVLGRKVKTSPDPRRSLMDWMRQDDNPYFAAVFVNRVWANYFHRGLIEPVDDLNQANPPSHPRLLAYLRREFVRRKFDMKWLHREITNSQAYQRSWRPKATNRMDRRNYSRSIPRRIPAEVVYDALAQVAVGNAKMKQVRSQLDRRAIGHLATKLTGTYAMNVFGKPSRMLQCDCERSNEPSLLQSIFLQNDPILRWRMTNSEWLTEIKKAKSSRVDRWVKQAYLRTFSRLPTKGELKRASKYVASSKSAHTGMEDLLWALINSKEFILNH